MKNKFLLISVLLSAFVTTSCTNKKSDTEAGDAAGIAAANKAPAADEINNNLSINSVGETMAYDKNDLTVKANADVTLTMKNNSTTLQHNWVLVKPGTEGPVGLAGIKVGVAKGFIPDTPPASLDILAHTKLIDPQGADSITFKAPPPGDYPYICTNAGHHTVMKGVLHSK
jgi:azurin